jgi:hypothetical protein
VAARLTATLSVSVPSPPSTVSPVVKVVLLAPMESLPAVVVSASTPVVSVYDLPAVTAVWTPLMVEMEQTHSTTQLMSLR